MSVKKMRDDQKNKAELLQEVQTLRERVAKLMQTEEALRESEEKCQRFVRHKTIPANILLSLRRNQPTPKLL